MKSKNLILVLGCILVGFIYRILPGHPFNFTPIAAMAFVGGMYINKRALAFAAPLVALFLSDFILNNTINRTFFPEVNGMVFWSHYMAFTYGAFLLTVVLGILLAKKAVPMKILLGGLGASILFFVISNFGSWLTLPMYPKTAGGLLSAYAAGIPFFKNTLLSNFLFIPLFVGTIEFFKNYSGAVKSVGA